MTISPADDPVLKKLRKALDELYGAQLERVVLYGSRARSDARPDLDYDVAVFVRHPGSFGKESGRIGLVETDILHDTGSVITVLPFHAATYRDDTPLVHEIRQDGREL